MTAVGIDFGTSNCVVAVCDSMSAVIDVPEVDAVDATWRGIGFERVFPSTISYLPDGFLYGWAAKFAEFDRLDAVKRLFESTESLTLGTLTTDPTTFSAAVLAELRRRVRDGGLAFQDAVISVPANATVGQRTGTMEAARRAGIRPIHLINEPTAGALAFMWHLPVDQRDGSYLVFDWGGGTLDVTVLEHSAGVNDEVTSRGVKRLGGIDFDDRFRLLVSDKLGSGIDFNATQLQALERKKIALSTESVVHFSAGGRSTRVLRSEMESAIADLVESARTVVDEVLADYGRPVDWPVLVGGSSQIPAARRAVADTIEQHHRRLGLAEDEVRIRLVSPHHFDPMTAVAEGASIAASIAAGNHGHEQLHLTLANDMGTVVHGEDKAKRGFSRIIERGTKLPTRARKQYVFLSPSPTIKSTVRIVEGDADKPMDDPSNVVLDRVRVAVPADLLRGKNRSFTLEYAYDHNAILRVRATWNEPRRPLFEKAFDLASGSARDGIWEEHLDLLSRPPSSMLDTGPEGAETLVQTADRVSAGLAGDGPESGPVVIVDGSNIASEVSMREAGNQISYIRLKAAIDQFLSERELSREGLVVIVDANFRYLVPEEERGSVESDRAHRRLVWPPAQARGKADALILLVAQRRLAGRETIVVTNDSFREFRNEFEDVFAGAQFWGATLVPPDIIFQARRMG